ncbi:MULTISPECIES: RDD family protein [Halorussus]|uniref:RDD family protein n=1 Tax=Halorussus TaxID=1070314 RepID=UPI0020A09934|nr:RDD family protein [Halorussus vallis]USZ74796.1 RDD family protein [Halorussus vallis]
MRRSTRSDDIELATVRRRVGAYLLDVLVVGGGVVAAAPRLGRTRRERSLLVGVLGLVVANLYHVLLEGVLGRTVGKAAVGVRVATTDGGRCTVRAATIRTLFRFVDWLPAGYLAGFVSIALTERRRRLGDLAAGTVVLRTEDD